MKKYLSKMAASALVIAMLIPSSAINVMAADEPDEIVEMPFTMTSDGETLEVTTITGRGYCYTDYYGNETVVDLYTVSIPEGTETVDLAFDGERLVYNYDGEGNYLDGWVDDATVGATEVTVSVDSDGDEYPDYIQVQNPYTVDEDGNWGGGELLYAINFEEVKNTTDMNFTVYADGEALTDPVVTEDGYTYTDYNGNTTTVDLYTYELTDGITSVDLEFPYKRLVYNYDADGETWLDGWYDDCVNGSKTKTCSIDANDDGMIDILQVQNVYNSDWTGAEVLYAVTFDVEHTFDAIRKATTEADGCSCCSVCGMKEYGGTVIPMVEKWSVTPSSYVYNGKAKKPTVVVKDSTGRKLVNGTDYKVSYASGRKSVGAYEVTITLKGNYEGTITKSFKILPKSTEITSKKAGSKSFTLTWKQLSSHVTGYEIAYSTDKSMDNAKYVYVKGNKTVSAAVKSLKSGKKYYVKVRSYTKVDGTKYYSAWSALKSVTTK